nr:MAG TPA: tyrosine recombinase [Caudoviricetes sp.]
MLINFEKRTEENKETVAISEYEENKITWINDDENNGYLSERTKITYLGVMNTHILDVEKMYNKDLRLFTSVEIQNLVKSAITNSVSTKRTIFAAINNYMVYCVLRGFISYNPCDVIDTTNLFKVNIKVHQKNYTTLDGFYEFLDNLDGSVIDKMMFLMCRYGINVNEMGTIRWDDVDLVNGKRIKVMRKDQVIWLDIDDRFIDYVKRCKNCKEKVVMATGRRREGDSKNVSHKEYYDYGYIIKSTVEGKEVVSPNSIYNSMAAICKINEISKIDVNLLSKARAYDYCLDLYAKKGILENKDLIAVLKHLSQTSTPNAASVLKKRLLGIFNIKIKDNDTKRCVEVLKDCEVLGRFDSIKELVNKSEELFDTKFDKSAISRCSKTGGSHKGFQFRFIEE